MRRRGAGFSIQTPGASAISPATALLSPDINEDTNRIAVNVNVNNLFIIKYLAVTRLSRI